MKMFLMTIMMAFAFAGSMYAVTAVPQKAPVENTTAASLESLTQKTDQTDQSDDDFDEEEIAFDVDDNEDDQE